MYKALLAIPLVLLASPSNSAGPQNLEEVTIQIQYYWDHEQPLPRCFGAYGCSRSIHFGGRSRALYESRVYDPEPRSWRQGRVNRGGPKPYTGRAPSAYGGEFEY